jgi:hypothetical protein
VTAFLPLAVLEKVNTLGPLVSATAGSTAPTASIDSSSAPTQSLFILIPHLARPLS